MIWREKKWMLITLVVLLLLNLAFFFAYRLRYEERIESLTAELDRVSMELREERMRNRLAVSKIASRGSTIEDLRRVYDEHWALKDQRLAALLVELQQLATRSGLYPAGRTYTLKETNARERAISGADSLTVAFSVRGSYDEVRNLVNLIELSRHFLIIDAITITDSDSTGKNLTLNLTIRTVFKADESELPEAAVI